MSDNYSTAMLASILMGMIAFWLFVSALIDIIARYLRIRFGGEVIEDQAPLPQSTQSFSGQAANPDR